MATPSEPPVAHGRDWQETVATVLLVVAAVATSWSSYQATRWNGEQSVAAGRTNAIRFEASRADSLAEAQREIDVATFLAWVEADQAGDSSLARFVEDRFRDEFRTAYDAWRATDPFEDRGAPPTPFAMQEYQLASATEAEELDAQAEESAAQVRDHVQRASNYVLTVVLYAVALFFAGMSTRVAARRLRWALTVAGCAVFIGTLAWIATFPVSIAV